MTHARLDLGGLQWPCPNEQHSGTAILHRDAFAIGPRAYLQATLYQFNAGTMTGPTRNSELRPSDVLDMSSDDARRLGLCDGQLVRLRSRYGTAMLPVSISAAMQPGQLFATFQTPGVLLNSLTGPNRDRWVGTPEYKVTAVQIESSSLS
jgi:formate dehydrogenase major subunit